MELREYIAIFGRHIKIFWFFVLLCTFLGLAWQKNQVEAYDVTLLLNIGRSGVQNTQDYTYDSFYRLQADERFADTVVRWLGSPRIIEDIYAGTGLDTNSASLRGVKLSFTAKRLSSQIVEVSFSSRNKGMASDVSRSVTKVLNRYTESLNKGDQEPSWFVLIGSDPVVHDGRVPLSPALAVGFVIGIFVGFWAVYVRHYFHNE